MTSDPDPRRPEQGRMSGRIGWRRLAGLAALAAVLIGTMVALSIRHTIRSSVKEPRPARAMIPAAAPPVAPALPEPSIVAVAPLPRAAPAPVPGPKPEPEEEAAPPAEEGGLADARDAILRAAPEALVKGKAVRWKAGPMRGYVVPSEEQDDGRRVCRNVYATTIDGPDQQLGRSQRWCRPVDGNGWAPE